MPDLRLEMIAWREVFSQSKRSFFFFGGVLVLLVTLFFLFIWQYQIFSNQFAQLTEEVEIIAEVNEGLPEDQIQLLQAEIEKFSGVEEVEYWPTSQVLSFINNRLFSGYEAFLQEFQLDVPIQPLFRIHLSDFKVRQQVASQIQDRFSSQILVIDLPVLENQDSFAFRFLENIRLSQAQFEWMLILLLILILALFGYTILFSLMERSRGFHLSQLLHFSPAYRFFPSFLFFTGFAFILALIGMILAFFFIGHFLLSFMLLLWGAFVLVVAGVMVAEGR